jgi:transposase
MLPNEKDKENLVIDLVKKGHTTRQIAKMAQVSFPYLKKIRQRLAGGFNEKQQQQVPAYSEENNSKTE